MKKPSEPAFDVAAQRPLVDLGFDFEGDWMDRLRESETPLQLGSIGEYELIEEVSRGGQGIVFRALQPGTHRVIALKRMLGGSLATPSMRRRFEREVEAASGLRHPNVVTVYGMEVVDGCPVLAMEWIDGAPITDWCRGSVVDADGDPRGTRRDPQDVLEVFVRVCDGIRHAHSRGVLHRDLKPSNVLVDVRGEPHVLDFGLAKHLDSEDAEALELESVTGTTGFLGTPAYASPEQFHTDELRLDARADVYSLGVLLFEMLTGESPYGRTRTVTELVQRIETADPPRPSSFDPRLGREVDTIVRKALAKDREHRYASVDALAIDVRRFLAGQPILAVEPSSWYLVAKLVGRNRLAVAFAATVLLLILGFGAFASWQAWNLKEQRDDAVDARNEMYVQKAAADDAARKLESLLLQLSDPAGAAAAGGWRASHIGPAGPGDHGRIVLEGLLPECTEQRPWTPNPDYDPNEYDPRALHDPGFDGP